MSDHDELRPGENIELTQISVETFPLNTHFINKDFFQIVFQDCSNSHPIGEVLDAWVDKLHEFGIRTERDHWK